jgi:hypothetical protein
MNKRRRLAMNKSTGRHLQPQRDWTRSKVERDLFEPVMYLGIRPVEGTSRIMMGEANGSVDVRCARNPTAYVRSGCGSICGEFVVGPLDSP